MRAGIRELTSLLIFGVALAAAFLCWRSPRPDYGMDLQVADGRMIVQTVDYGSMAWEAGLQPGMIITAIGGDRGSAGDLLADPDPSTMRAAIEIAHGEWISYVNAVRDSEYDVERELERQNVATPYHDGYPTIAQSFWIETYGRTSDFIPILAALALFVGGWWWLRNDKSGRAGLRPFAVTLPLATSMPVLVVAIVRFHLLATMLLASLLVAYAMVIVGLQFASLIEDRRRRLAVDGITVALAVVAALAALLVPNDRGGSSGVFSFLWAVAAAAVSLVPGLVAVRLAGEKGILGYGPIQSLSDLAPACVPIATPSIAALTLFDTTGYSLTPIAVWLLVLLGRRVGADRLRRTLSRTTLQRDLVVAATERERARIAGDIHDYALQDLTMLVRRLDAAGDVENATAARGVADRLRAICGDLRLPILDDLGVGPALDWLVGRLEPDTEKLELELSDRERRLTPDAELAFFRVAQEAIANAIHHGAPPILVRYWGGGDWAELIVDDCGPGIPVGAAEAAEKTGHLGLMSMSQRAEAIDAELTFGRRPGGGARVHMIWERNGVAVERPTETTRPTESAPAVEPAADPA